MKKINYKVVVLVASTTFLISGCETMQKASSAMGSTGTGVIAGVLAGAGTGIACDKLTGGRNTGACVAAGMAVGAAVGTLAASMDETAEKAVPAMDCASVKKRMNYSSASFKPRASLKFSSSPAQVVKQNEKIQVPLKMDLAAPGTEQEVSFRIVTTDATGTSTGKPLTKVCGGDYPLPFSLNTDKEGVYNTTIRLIDASNNSDIEGGLINFCYTVAKDGINKCGMAAN